MIRVVTMAGVAFLLVMGATTRQHDAPPWAGTRIVDSYTAPHWQTSYVERFPRCSPKRALTPQVLVENQDGKLMLTPFDAAMHASTDTNPANDIWIVGYCGRERDRALSTAITDAIKLELTQAAPEDRKIALVGNAGSTLRLTYVESWWIDSRKLKAEDPETYVQYARKSGTWTLRAKSTA